MAFPVNLQPILNGYDIEAAPYGTYGFTYGSAFYLFLYQGSIAFTPYEGDYKVHALKSTDGGLTWTEQDAAHAFLITQGASYGSTYTVARDGDTALIVAPLGHIANSPSPAHFVFDGIDVIRFDLASDTWGTSSHFSAPAMNTLEHRTTGAGASRQIFCQITVRGPGDYIFFYSGPTQTISSFVYSRLYYATFDGATFGTGTILPGQTGNAISYYGTGCICDGSGNTHFFYEDEEYCGVGFRIYHAYAERQ